MSKIKVDISFAKSVITEESQVVHWIAGAD